ncbi:hypothetical protein [Bradyrhizobium sp. RT9a]|uniref:hypothetical protein n=1 Tax=Bradyrhizobium sp. RT9a TaxID=3156384 RepID=UPI0033950C5C
MMLKRETVGFTRAGMLFLEPPHRWRAWQRDVWACCSDDHRPRRCDTDLCDAGGDCIACDAVQGEACQAPRKGPQ